MPKPKKSSSVYHHKLEMQQHSYKHTLWYPVQRIQKVDGDCSTLTTSFTNDNPEHPIGYLYYETTSNSDKVSLTVMVRDVSRQAILPILLAAQLHPHRSYSTASTIPKTMRFGNIDDDSSIFNFICDNLFPTCVIDGQQVQFGSIYFMLEHRKTIAAANEQDQSPIIKAATAILSLYKKCINDKKEFEAPTIRIIKDPSRTLKLS